MSLDLTSRLVTKIGCTYVFSEKSVSSNGIIEKKNDRKTPLHMGNKQINIIQLCCSKVVALFLLYLISPTIHQAISDARILEKKDA